MKIPTLDRFPSAIRNRDLHRSFETILSGLRSDPPDAFGEDWEEKMEEVERLLVEVKATEPD